MMISVISMFQFKLYSDYLYIFVSVVLSVGLSCLQGRHIYRVFTETTNRGHQSYISLNALSFLKYLLVTLFITLQLLVSFFYSFSQSNLSLASIRLCITCIHATCLLLLFHNLQSHFLCRPMQTALLQKKTDLVWVFANVNLAPESVGWTVTK